MKRKLPRMLLHYVLDENNQLVEADLMTWARWFENVNNRIVGYTQITSEVHVSTICVGLPMIPFDDGPPRVFETMIFGGPLDHSQWRYSSWDDADTGHKAAVRKAREAQGQRVSRKGRVE